MKRVNKDLYADEDDEELTEKLELPGVMNEEQEQEPLVSRFRDSCYLYNVE